MRRKRNHETLSNLSPGSPFGLIPFIGINTHSLVDQERREATKNGGGEEDPEYIASTDLCLELVEHERGEDSSAFASSSRKTMCSGADAGRERFSGNND